MARNKPQPAYDYRRALTLVQMIALADDGSALIELSKGWGIDSGGTYEDLVVRLAQHALAHAREQRDGKA